MGVVKGITRLSLMAPTFDLVFLPDLGFHEEMQRIFTVQLNYFIPVILVDTVQPQWEKELQKTEDGNSGAHVNKTLFKWLHLKS